MSLLGITSFDELNKLVGMKKSDPFDEYFAPMKISEEQKKQRIRLAKRLEEEFLYVFSYMFYAYPIINGEMITDLRDRYMQQLLELGIATSIADDLYRRQAYKFAVDAISATQRHKEDPYYYSADRARFCAEDQSCFICDKKDFADALEAGMRYKTWETIGDNHVRNSHLEVEGMTIPIEDVFVLEGGLLRYPHDTEMGASDDEVCGCRCTLSFS